ncbi:acyltransferase [Latilactobacillus sakei]|uniref:acyltransferase family protein n=1 Tax=Latilactobacillus sakei TaxID=1599 RepID=UPI000976E2CE|nr:acyltransferase family protein [Latilactobacillus sakei]MDH0601733.1 acetyltransferase [Latilactobacillus sakei]MDR7923664.1 acyltransferase family protein [Latilactobacillus sakei subsp. sakei]QPG04132.1 acetyltransferase [Latilactobacillus sakei]USF96335.1 acyltransferase [Latilactobacillus sakei]SOB37310.1 Acyltransferase [Latilactobacillus sakei]
MAGKKRLNNSRYITGFDGLRAIGVIGVILYHLMPYTFTGGYLGVPIFMVVSGYLITDLLVQEWEQNHWINLKSFYLRRVKRLYPGLLTMLFATGAYITLFERQMLHNLNQIIITNILYVYNWWQIGHGQSYFDRFANNESPFTHLWTLSIEGQFYLLWPFVVVALIIGFKNKGRIARVLLGAGLVSAIWMAILYHPNADPSRLYYGTDTRMFSILVGAALAFVWPSTALKQKIIPRQRWTLDGIGLLSTITMLILMVKMNAESAFVYRGGLFIFSLLICVLVAVVAHPGSDWNRLLTNPVFNWLGKRSYGIYLYQFPVMIFFEGVFKNVAAHPVLYPVIEVAIIFGLTELSYRFIEQPLAHYPYQELGQRMRQFVKHPTLNRQSGLVFGMAIVFLVGLVGAIQAPGQPAPDAHKSALAVNIQKNKKENDARNKALVEKAKAQNKQQKKAKSKAQADKEAEAAAQKHPVNQEYEKYGLTQVELQKAQSMPITAIGDSVLLDAGKTLQTLFPNMLVDASVGRQLNKSTPVVDSYAQKGALSDTVLISLGTNGSFTQAQLDEFMAAIGSQRKVFWLNAYVPTRPWQNDVNQMLKGAAKKYPNLTIINWYDQARKHGDWFYDDQVHPNPVGVKEYAAIVTKALVKQ